MGIFGKIATKAQEFVTEVQGTEPPPRAERDRINAEAKAAEQTAKRTTGK